MRICYRSCRSNRLTVYEQTGTLDFCWHEMRDEWGVLIGFGIKGHPWTTSREVNIFTSHHMQIIGNVILGITEIRYCPCCGEEFEIVRLIIAGFVVVPVVPRELRTLDWNYIVAAFADAEIHEILICIFDVNSRSRRCPFLRLDPDAFLPSSLR